MLAFLGVVCRRERNLEALYTIVCESKKLRVRRNRVSLNRTEAAARRENCFEDYFFINFAGFYGQIRWRDSR